MRGWSSGLCRRPWPCQQKARFLKASPPTPANLPPQPARALQKGFQKAETSIVRGKLHFQISTIVIRETRLNFAKM